MTKLLIIIFANSITLTTDLISQVPISPLFYPSIKIDLLRIEREALHYIAGAIARFLYNLSKLLYIRKAKPIILCPTCEFLLTYQIILENISFNQNIISINLSNEENICEDSRFSQLVNRGGLFVVSPKIFQYIVDIEAVLTKFIQSNFQSENVLESVCKNVSSELVPNIPLCCNLPDLILKRTVLILSHRFLSSVFNSALSSEIVSSDMSTSGGRFRLHFKNLNNHSY